MPHPPEIVQFLPTLVLPAIAVFAAIAVAQTIAIESVGLIGLALIGLSTGFAADFAVTKAKKDDTE